ncbi:hypothetical protein [Streptomyces sp. NPDC015125]|uniref:hypothetical protein n=1 Tax=Streptomyces sp. NPDC015125 TaxID=3364938 RepID=UPI0037022D21
MLRRLFGAAGVLLAVPGEYGVAVAADVAVAVVGAVRIAGRGVPVDAHRIGGKAGGGGDFLCGDVLGEAGERLVYGVVDHVLTAAHGGHLLELLGTVGHLGPGQAVLAVLLR